MRGAITDGVDIIERGAAAEVHIDPVRAGRARRDQRADRRHNPDADHHHVARHVLAIIEPDAGYLALPQHRMHPGRKAHVDALTAVFLGVEGGELLARHPGEQARQHLDQRDLAAELAQHRGGLEPDIAAADHHRALRPGFERGHHRIGIAFVADIEHLGQHRARHRQAARIAPA